MSFAFSNRDPFDARPARAQQSPQRRASRRRTGMSAHQIPDSATIRGLPEQVPPTAADSFMPASDILIRGAREHNLRDVNLLLPRNRLICFTGVSGSGKSSLAFDTLYAEGQRRYVQSLSSFARQFLGQMPKPDVDLISGLNPAISISQKAGGQNPRSTVGTITEIYDYLRVLYARVGKGHCPQCGRPITAQTREQIIERILALPAGTQFLVLAPLIRGQKGEYRDLFADLLEAGIRPRTGRWPGGPAERRSAARPPDAAHHRGRRRSAGGRIEGAAATGRSGGVGVAAGRGEPDGGGGGGERREEETGEAERAETSRQETSPRPRSLIPLRLSASPPSALSFSAHYACTHCNLSFEPPSPQLFSFNNPQGMCLECSGLGQIYTFDPAAADSRSGPLVPAGLHRIGRLVEGDGPLAAAHLSRRGRNARTQSRPAAGHGAGNGLGGTRSEAATRPALGHRRPARHLHLAERPVGLQVGRKVRGHHPQAALAISHHQEPHATTPVGKVHVRARLRPLPRRAVESAGQGGHGRQPRGEVRRSPPAQPARGLRLGRFRGRGVFRRVGVGRHRPEDRRRRAQGDSRPAGIPQERGPRISHLGPHRADAFRRRDAAHPAGRPGRLRAGGRALHPRRAFDRPAPPRQRPPAGNARPAPRSGQHRDRRRARRGHDAGGRPHRRFRPRTGRPRRARRGRRAARTR